jgi:small GTP-binding protein
MSEPESIKVVLLGESGVGKTSIITQFTSGTFDPHRQTSLSAQFVSKTLEFPDLGQSLKFDIWDTVGQEKYRSLAKIFYKDAKVIIFVYDVTREFSFEGIQNYWYKETSENWDGKPILALVGNKIDLYNDLKVSNNDGKEFANKIGAIFQTTSALSNSGISNLFENVRKTYLVPGYDYQSQDKKAQEEFMKKKLEETGKKDKKKTTQKGVKLEDAKKPAGKNGGCCK